MEKLEKFKSCCSGGVVEVEVTCCVPFCVVSNPYFSVNTSHSPWRDTWAGHVSRVTCHTCTHLPPLAHPLYQLRGGGQLPDGGHGGGVRELHPGQPGALLAGQGHRDPGLPGGGPAGWLLPAGGEGDGYGPAAGLSPVLVPVHGVHQVRGLHVHADLHGHNIEQAPAGGEATLKLEDRS